jgi:glycosyltransferase involved in cell wall biosynthesis
VHPTPRVLALIPAHDEAPRIAAVVRAASVTCRSSSSTTARPTTRPSAEAAGATVLSQHPNQGKGAALRAGFARAIADGALAVVTLDGDGQHDPAELPRFVAAERERPSELIVGKRDFGRMPLARRLSNSAGTVFLSAAVGRWIPDNQSGYRLVGRRLMAEMLASREDGFAFEVEMIAVCLREGWPIRWVPISTIYGDERSHIRPLQHLREFMAVAVRARRIVRGGRG